MFWTEQNAAIDARREAYLDAGWPDVVISLSGEYLHRRPIRATGEYFHK
jgi:ParB family chromosome partitioning protein